MLPVNFTYLSKKIEFEKKLDNPVFFLVHSKSLKYWGYLPRQNLWLYLAPSIRFTHATFKDKQCSRKLSFVRQLVELVISRSRANSKNLGHIWSEESFARRAFSFMNKVQVLEPLPSYPGIIFEGIIFGHNIWRWRDSIVSLTTNSFVNCSYLVTANSFVNWMASYTSKRYSRSNVPFRDWNRVP